MQGRYSLTELGLSVIPLLVELGRLGATIDPSTADHAPHFDADGPGSLEGRLGALRADHL